MRRNATRTGPGIARSPKAHLRTVRSSTSKACAAARCVKPSAAIAALNSSADTADNTLCVDRKTGSSEDRPQSVDRVILREAVRQRAVSSEKRQALWTILAAADEADSIGGEGGAGGWLAHEPLIGPVGLCRQGVKA